MSGTQFLVGFLTQWYVVHTSSRSLAIHCISDHQIAFLRIVFGLVSVAFEDADVKNIFTKYNSQQTEHSCRRLYRKFIPTAINGSLGY